MGSQKEWRVIQDDHSYTVRAPGHVISQNPNKLYPKYAEETEGRDIPLEQYELRGLMEAVSAGLAQAAYIAGERVEGGQQVVNGTAGDEPDDAVWNFMTEAMDWEAIYASVKKTNKVIILQEDTLFGGVASDISAMIMENCFEYLDAPVKRVGSLESAIPFMKTLEDQYLPKGRFETALKELLAY